MNPRSQTAGTNRPFHIVFYLTSVVAILGVWPLRLFAEEKLGLEISSSAIWQDSILVFLSFAGVFLAPVLLHAFLLMRSMGRMATGDKGKPAWGYCRIYSFFLRSEDPESVGKQTLRAIVVNIGFLIPAGYMLVDLLINSALNKGAAIVVVMAPLVMGYLFLVGALCGLAGSVSVEVFFRILPGGRAS